MPFIVTSPDPTGKTPFVIFGSYSDKDGAKSAINDFLTDENRNRNKTVSGDNFDSLTIHEVKPEAEVYTFNRSELDSLRATLKSARQPASANDAVSNSEILMRAQRAGRKVEAQVVHHAPRQTR